MSSPMKPELKLKQKTKDIDRPMDYETYGPTTWRIFEDNTYSLVIGQVVYGMVDGSDKLGFCSFTKDGDTVGVFDSLRDACAALRKHWSLIRKEISQ